MRMASALACLAALSSAYSRVSAVAGLRELPGATIVSGGLVAFGHRTIPGACLGMDRHYDPRPPRHWCGSPRLVRRRRITCRAPACAHGPAPRAYRRRRQRDHGAHRRRPARPVLLPSLYEQVILHYGAITAGLSQLPFALALIAAAGAAAPLIARRGSKTVLSAGLVLLAGGLVWFGRNHNGPSINGQATWPPNLVPLIYPLAGIGITIS